MKSSRRQCLEALRNIPRHSLIAFFVYCTVFVCGGECKITAGSSGSPHSFSPALLVAAACYVYMSVVAYVHL